MGKLYAEANENIDERQLEGVRASGGNWFEVIRFAVLPQVLPNFTTYTLWRLELNIRSAAIVGFVGAGGIGQELYHAISFNYYEDVSAIVLMVVVTIMVIDLICEKLRHRLIGKETCNELRRAPSIPASSPRSGGAIRARLRGRRAARGAGGDPDRPGRLRRVLPGALRRHRTRVSTASTASARSPARCSRRRRATRSGILCGPCSRASAWRSSAR